MKSVHVFFVLGIALVMAFAGTALAGLHDAPYGYDFLAWSGTVDDWTNSGTTSYATGHTAPNSVKFDNTGDYIVSPTIDNPDTLKFWLKGNSTTTPGTFKVYAQVAGGGYTEIRTCTWGAGMDIPNGTYAEVVIGLSAPFENAQDVDFKFVYELKNVGNVAMDDFSVTMGTGGGDTTPPAISSITVISNTSIDVLFNESVQQATAETEANYVVTPGSIVPTLATRDATNLALVHLTFATLADNSYTLTVNAVQDLVGNACVNATGNFIINTAVVQAGDVVITEVMYDDTASTDVEWVEIHNTTGATIDISGWTLLDGNTYPGPGTEGQIVLPALTTITAGQYLVISKVALPEITGEVVGAGTASWTLGNSGDNLSLYTAATGGTLIDGSLTVNYPDLATGGNSIEKCDPDAAWSGNAVDWHESTNVFATTGRYRLCTPGAANSACAGDTTRPTITSVTVISNTAIDVLFSEYVSQVTAETVGNYVVTPGSLVPTLATRDATNFALVHLTFAPLADNAYTLTANGVQDLAGNACINATGTFSIATPSGGVRINEIMYDDTASADLEWVEIHNTTAAPIDISGWVLIDAGTYPASGSEGGIQVPASTTLPANGYMVLSKDTLPDITGEVICSQYKATWALGNSGDNLALYTDDSTGTLVDGIATTVTTNFYPDLSDPGYSLEKCDEHAAWTGTPSAWHMSTNVYSTGRYLNCTPGAANSVCVVDTTRPTILSAAQVSPNAVDVTFSEDVDLTTAETATNYSVDLGVGNPTSAVRQTNWAVVRLTFGAVFAPNTYTLTVNNVQDLASNAILPNSQVQFIVSPPPANIIFTEIIPDPNFSGLADSLGEWFEIYNAGTSSVDMTGWLISDNAGTDTLESPATINPGQYFVFASNGDSATNGGVPENYAYQYATSGGGLSLSNTADSLVLKTGSGVLVAYVAYNSAYGFMAGRSAQLRNLTDDPHVAANWCWASTIWSGATQRDRGTPGAATICGSTASPLSRTICQLRQQDACGFPVNEGERVVFQGVVTYADSCRRNAYIEANNCAMLLYGNAVRYNMVNDTRRMRAGDQVQVEGYLKLYNGLSEIDSMLGLLPVVTLLTTGNALPNPVTLTAAQADYHLADCSLEPREAQHVFIPSVTFVAGDGIATFAAGTNYLAYSGTDTILFRTQTGVCEPLLGTLIPQGPTPLVAVVGQYDNTSCYCSGYQLMTGGFAPFTVPFCADPTSLTVLRDGILDQVVLYWSPGVNQNCNCYSIYYTLDATAVFPAGYTYLNYVVGVTTYTDASPFAAKRFYVVTGGGVNCP